MTIKGTLILMLQKAGFKFLTLRHHFSQGVPSKAAYINPFMWLIKTG